jgi:hypothetical protein
MEFLSKGKENEANFAKSLIISEGGILHPVSKTDDIKKHIDVIWSKSNNGKLCTFDVKGARKNKRSDKDITYDTTWLELQNVNGKPGSLYGEQDYFAFELEHKWVIVRREELLQALLNEIKDDTLYTINPQENFKKYQRKGRKDIIVRVPMSFIEKNSRKYISK